MSVTRTFTVTVVSTDSGNKYYIDGVQQATLELVEGATFRFDQSDNSNNGHPLRFSTTSNGTHSGGSEYTTGVTTNGTPGSSGAYTQIQVASDAPTLSTSCLYLFSYSVNISCGPFKKAYVSARQQYNSPLGKFRLI